MAPLRFRSLQTFKVGVELDAPVGLNDGTARDIKRFACKPHAGAFVVARKILLVTGQSVNVKGFQGAGQVGCRGGGGGGGGGLGGGGGGDGGGGGGGGCAVAVTVAVTVVVPRLYRAVAVPWL